MMNMEQRREKKELVIPDSFFDTPYDASKYPGSSPNMTVRAGANCQYFAFEVLRHFGILIPDFRSSDLWDDQVYTRKVQLLKPLDILFFHSKSDPYGSHVGVYLGNERVIHLSKEVGYPVIWNLQQFKDRKRYRYFIGAKRARSVRKMDALRKGENEFLDRSR